MRHDGISTLGRAGTLGFVLLSACTLIAFAACWILPVYTYFMGNPFASCFGASNLPGEILDYNSIETTLSIFPPNVECTWRLGEERISRTVSLTPVSFPLLLAVQLAFIAVVSARRELRGS